MTIREEKSSVVKAGVWEIDEKDERLLDRYEGYPYLYHKVVIPELIIIVDEHPEDSEDDIPEAFVSDAFVYIMNENANMPLKPPEDSYYKRCEEGYRDFNLPLKPLAESKNEALGAAEKRNKTGG